MGTETTPESFLNALAHEGLIILSVVDEETFLIRLGYQRYGDILCAISLVEALDSDTAKEGEQWVALSHSYWDEDKAPNENSWNSPYLAVRAYYSSALINESIQNFKQKSARDIFQYNQGNSCYRGYLAEYPDSPVYKQLLNNEEDSEAFNFTEVSLLRGSEWEYDYSYTTPERQDNLIAPCQGIIQKLELLWDCQSGWVDRSGKLIAFHHKGVRQSG
nr:hypothetical protein [Escherichia coli]